MPLPAKQLPSQADLLRLLNYDSVTGILYWRPRQPTNRVNRTFNQTFAGKLAGFTAGNGYVVVEIHVVAYKAHRIIWKMVTGREPPDWIDHKDQDRGNNSWDNLREATQRQNSYNGRLSPLNSSGFRCVSFIRAHGKYRAAVQIDGKKKHIGYFLTAEDAHAAAADVIRRTRDEFART